MASSRVTVSQGYLLWWACRDRSLYIVGSRTLNILTSVVVSVVFLFHVHRRYNPTNHIKETSLVLNRLWLFCVFPRQGRTELCWNSGEMPRIASIRPSGCSTFALWAFSSISNSPMSLGRPGAPVPTRSRACGNVAGSVPNKSRAHGAHQWPSLGCGC